MNSKVFEELLSQLKKDGSLALIVMLLAIMQFTSAVGAERLDLRVAGVWGFVVFVSGILCVSQRIKEGRHVRLKKTLEGLKAQFSEFDVAGVGLSPKMLDREIGALMRRVNQKQSPARITLAMLWGGALLIGIGLVTACMSNVALMLTALLVGGGALVVSGGFLTAAFLPEPVLAEARKYVCKLQMLAEKLDKTALAEGDEEVERALLRRAKRSRLLLPDARPRKEFPHDSNVGGSGGVAI